MSLIEQEMVQERCINIPEEVREIYKLCRPLPLFRARGLEKFPDTPALIYFKNEGVSISSSHKCNTSVPQAFYNMINGTNHGLLDLASYDDYNQGNIVDDTLEMTL